MDNPVSRGGGKQCTCGNVSEYELCAARGALRIAFALCMFVLVSCAARRCHSVGVHFDLAQSQYHVARHGETGRCAIAFVDRCQFSLGFPGLAARAAGPNRRESIVRVPSCAHLYMFVLWFSFSRSHSHDLRFSTGTKGLLESSRA